MKSFFVSCALGLENDLKNEIIEFWHLLIDKTGQNQVSELPEFQIFDGGIEFSCPYEIGLQINFFSKLSNRVLLRVGQFKAKAFSELEKGLHHIQWTEYLRDQKILIDVSSHGSRLYHKKKIEEFVAGYLTKNKTPKGQNSVQTIYIRISDDVCTVSLDTSGEHLHRRGWADLKGEAPLRETLAAWIIKQLINETPLSEIQNVNLIDPMCGSGTFLTESLLYYKPNIFRSYSFQNFPNCSKILLTEGFKKKIFLESPSFISQLQGYDQNPKTTLVAEKNKENVIRILSEKFPTESWAENVAKFSIKTGDLFSLNPQEKKFDQPGSTWVVVNPPYGERLKKTANFNEMLLQIIKVFSPEKIAFLSPKFELEGSLQNQYKKISRFPLLHGGLRLSLYVFEGRSST